MSRPIVLEQRKLTPREMFLAAREIERCTDEGQLYYFIWLAQERIKKLRSEVPVTQEQLRPGGTAQCAGVPGDREG